MLAWRQNKWRYSRYIAFAYTVLATLLCSLGSKGEALFYKEDMVIDIIIYLLIVPAMCFYGTKSAWLTTLRIQVKNPMSCKKWSVPDAQSNFFRVDDPTHGLHFSLYALSGAIIGFLISALMCFSITYLLFSIYGILTFASTRSLLVDLPKLFPDKYNA